MAAPRAVSRLGFLDRLGLSPPEGKPPHEVRVVLVDEDGWEARAASQLGIGTATLFRKLKQYGRGA